MKPVVVDTSVLAAGLFKDGTVRETLLSAEGIAFSAPHYLREETAHHLPRVASRAKLPQATVEAILEDLMGAIDLIPPAVYSTSMSSAHRLARAAQAIEDTEYIALCLTLGAPIWTLDQDFSRIPGLRVLSTREVVSL